MGKIPHGCATTTPATQRLIQQNTESLQTLAKRFGIDPKTMAKWRKRTSIDEAVRGPAPASTVLTPAEEAAIVLFRHQTRLTLDDCLYALQEAIPYLRRSALHRCLQRHGVSRLPPGEELDETKKKKFKDYPIGYLHVDFAEVRTEEGKQYLFIAIDRTSKLAFAELHPQATQVVAVEFLRRVLPRLPHKVYKLLSDNGIQFRNLPHHLHVGRHPVGQLCDEWGFEQRFTKPAHPWTNGQVERMNRTVKEATIKRFHYETTDQLNTHLQAFLQALGLTHGFAKRANAARTGIFSLAMKVFSKPIRALLQFKCVSPKAYNFAKRLKRLQGLTPYEFVCAEWRKNSSNPSETLRTILWDHTRSHHQVPPGTARFFG